MGDATTAGKKALSTTDVSTIDVTSPADGDIIYAPDPITINWVAAPAVYSTINVCLFGNDGSQVGCFPAANWGTSILYKTDSFYQKTLLDTSINYIYFVLSTPDNKYIGRSGNFNLLPEPDPVTIPLENIEVHNYKLRDPPSDYAEPSEVDYWPPTIRVGS